MARVPGGRGPGLIHARVTRPYSHSAADSQAKYRGADELARELAHDPIDTFERALIGCGVLTTAAAAAIRREAKDAVARAADDALAARRPDPATVTDHVVRLPPGPRHRRAGRRPGRRAGPSGRRHRPGPARAPGRRRTDPGLR